MAPVGDGPVEELLVIDELDPVLGLAVQNGLVRGVQLGLVDELVVPVARRLLIVKLDARPTFVVVSEIESRLRRGFFVVGDPLETR